MSRPPILHSVHAQSPARQQPRKSEVREIEVKYRVHDLEALLLALKTRGVTLSDPVHQDDQAYAPQGWAFGDCKLGVSFVRLRTVNGHHTFTLKQPTINVQSCLEHETAVADREAMHHAILQMGYYATVRVAKTRRTANLDGLSLCVDDLEGVGTFLELERLVAEDVSEAAVQAELASFVTGLGTTAERTEETYDSLVRAARTG
jgi:adenylate cyclase class 2